MSYEVFFGKRFCPKVYHLTFFIILAIGSSNAFSSFANKRFYSMRGTDQCHSSVEVTGVKEVRFIFYPTEPKEDFNQSVYLVIRSSGDANALLFEQDGSRVVSAFSGLLPQADVSRLVERVQKSFGEANNSGDGVIRESDLFYLAAESEHGVEETGGKVEDKSAHTQMLVGDLRVLWRRFKEVACAAGYLRVTPMDKTRLEILRKNKSLRLASLNELPSDTQRTITDALDHLRAFYPLNKNQFDKLLSKRPLLLHKGSGYELNLFISQCKSAPNQ